MVVDGLGKQFLACAALAPDKDGIVGKCGLFSHIYACPHGSRPMYDVRESIAGIKTRLPEHAAHIAFFFPEIVFVLKYQIAAYMLVHEGNICFFSHIIYAVKFNKLVPKGFKLEKPGREDFFSGKV